MLRRVPRVRDLIGKPIDGRQGVGGLFVDHLCALVQRLPDLSAHARPAVLDGTLDLLALCLGEQPALPAPRLRQALRAQVQRYIEAHLTDATLGVTALAHRFRMTERNVHRLFEAAATRSARRSAAGASRCAAAISKAGCWRTARSPRSPATGASTTRASSASCSARPTACRPATAGRGPRAVEAPQPGQRLTRRGGAGRPPSGLRLTHKETPWTPP